MLKKKYFDETTDFFDRHGNKALVIGRFVPIVRTYITVVAGVSRMERRRFFDVERCRCASCGRLHSPCSATSSAGLPVAHRQARGRILLVVAVSLLPMVYEFVKHRRRAKALAAETADAAGDIADHATGSDRAS